MRLLSVDGAFHPARLQITWPRGQRQTSIHALRSKHRYTGRRARERSVQAQPTPSAEDRFPRLPPKGRFALSPRRQRRTGSCANATWPAASGRAFIPLAIGSWVGSDRKTRGREPSFHSAVNSLASDGGSAAGRPDRWLRNLVNLMSRQRRKDWRSVRKGACVWIVLRREGAARQTLSPGDRADPGLASVRGLDWPGPNRRREGCIPCPAN